MNKQDLKRLILRLLVEREAYGYDIIGQLSHKGVKPAKNYLYTILSEMEKEGLIKGEWVGPNPRKKHVFSLTHLGQEEFERSVKLALDFLMGAYNQWNKSETPLAVPVLAQYTSGLAPAVGFPMNKMNGTVVMAIGPFDPLVCYPNAFLAISSLNKSGKVYVVKDPEVNFTEVKPNMVVMDGWRNDMPLKEEMADTLIVAGFPCGVSEEKTIMEWARVLKKDGHLVAEVMNVMIKENSRPYLRFAEFVGKKYYEHDGRDRVVTLAKVRESLSKHFAITSELSVGDYTIFHGAEKFVTTEEPAYAKISSRA